VGGVATFSAPANWSGAETIILQACDLGPLCDTDNIIVTVTPVNDDPIVTDIPDLTITEDSVVTSIDLDDYVSDIDNTDAQITWTTSGNVNIGVSINPTTHVVTFTPAHDWYGVETITFIANDGNGGTASDISVVTVTPVADYKVVINEFVSYDPEWIELYNPEPVAVDISTWTIEDGTGTHYHLTGTIASHGFKLLTKGVDFNFALNNGGDIIILREESTLIIDQVTYGTWDDGNTADNAPTPLTPISVGRLPDGVDTDVDINDFHIINPQTPGTTNTGLGLDSTAPEILSIIPTIGSMVTSPVILSATTNENANCEYSTNMNFVYGTGTDFPITGNLVHSVTLVLSGGSTIYAPGDCDLNGIIEIPDVSCMNEIIADPTLCGTIYDCSNMDVDFDGNYDADDLAIVTGLVDNPIPGIYNYYIKCQDNTGNSNIDANQGMTSFKVISGSTNLIPIANAGPDQSVTTSTLVNLDGSASSDSDGTIVSYSWSIISSPAGSGASLTNPTTVSPTFTPDVNGAYVIQLIVRDNLGANSSPDLVVITSGITPPPVNTAPIFNPILSDKNIQEHNIFTYDINAIDSESDTITYSLVGPPAGMTIDPVTGIITWNDPTPVNVYPITISICDEHSLCTTGSFNLAVTVIPSGQTIIRSYIYGIYYPLNFVTDIPSPPTVTNTWVVDSSIGGTTANIISNSNLLYSDLVLISGGTPEINNCVLQGTATKRTTFTGYKCVNTYIDPSDVYMSNTENSVIKNSHVYYSTAISSTIDNSTIDYSTLDKDIIINTTLNSVTATNTNITNSTLVNITSTNSEINNSIINYSPIQITFKDAKVNNNKICSGSITTNAGEFLVTQCTNISKFINYVPTAIINADNNSGKDSLTVQFSAANSTDINLPSAYPLNDYLAYSWDFNNDGVIDSPNMEPTHIFTAGTYTVRLIVTDKFGLSSSTTTTISVSSSTVAPTTSTGPTGGGGNPTKNPATATGCVRNYNCTEWAGCINGIQRCNNLTDNNGCAPIAVGFASTITQRCEEINETVEEEPEEPAETVTGYLVAYGPIKLTKNQVMYGGFGLLGLILLLILYKIIKSFKKESTPEQIIQPYTAEETPWEKVVQEYAEGSRKKRR
ncbi:MAG: PKD domain-containing protein, partial [Candidatus Nanoarchaeia archaeon]|nr:PKD domain-containing protein [Candidatus Nanoarchaeia archaeon]